MLSNLASKEVSRATIIPVTFKHFGFNCITTYSSAKATELIFKPITASYSGSECLSDVLEA